MNEASLRTRSVQLTGPPAALTGHLKMGGRSKAGAEISVDSRGLWRDGKPWFPVMGEFHYARYPRQEWEAELRKMKAGGITVVGTYIFWILHEERRGTYRWDGERDLRSFVQLCAEVGLDLVARIGPWGHGEARNGAFPDWLLEMEIETRTNDSHYLDVVRRWYGEIAGQLGGLFFPDGGPVVGVQIENELYDQPEHLRTLKRLAQEFGFDVPLWTVTGWGRADIPRDEFIPLFGGYPEAAWDEHDAGWARQSRMHYFFTHVRDDFTIGSDIRQDDESAATGPDIERYPFATCELGGGMYTAYHRRPRIDADDIAAISLVKLGSGSTWQGYYMYHGGTQAKGVLSTMQESHATSYPNDCPVLSYDFQAPLSEFGQVRASFAALRQQATWIASEGPRLARMVMTLPDDTPSDVDDRSALRWAVRSDGDSGYVFVNNHQPVEDLMEHRGVQFEIDGVGGRRITLPAAGCTIPKGAFFAWPLRLDIGGPRLSASAQLLARVPVAGRDTLVLAATGEIPVELQVEGGSIRYAPEGARVSERSGRDDLTLVTGLMAGPTCKVTVEGPDGSADIYVVASTDARALSLVDGQIMLSSELVLGSPSGARVVTSAATVTVRRLTADGWSEHRLSGAPPEVPVSVEPLREAGPLRQIPRGGSLGRASAPVDKDFEAAAEWFIDTSDLAPLLNDSAEASAEDRAVVLRIDFVGDVARLYAGERLLADHFWYGATWEVSLDRFGAEAVREGLRLAVLPLAEDAPIYFSPDVQPPYESGAALGLASVTMQRRVTVALPTGSIPWRPGP